MYREAAAGHHQRHAPARHELRRREQEDLVPRLVPYILVYLALDHLSAGCGAGNSDADDADCGRRLLDDYLEGGESVLAVSFLSDGGWDVGMMAIMALHDIEGLGDGATGGRHRGAVRDISYFSNDQLWGRDALLPRARSLELGMTGPRLGEEVVLVALACTTRCLSSTYLDD